jgi:hypothetical protein
VRKFAAILFAEKKAAEEANARAAEKAAEERRKAEEARKAAFIRECRKLVAKGDMEAVYNAWGVEHGEQIADEVFEESRDGDEHRKFVGEWMEDHEDEVDEAYEEIKNAAIEDKHDWWQSEAYDQVREEHEGEIGDAFRNEIKDEIEAAMKEEFEKFVATIK